MKEDFHSEGQNFTVPYEIAFNKRTLLRSFIWFHLILLSLSSSSSADSAFSFDHGVQLRTSEPDLLLDTSRQATQNDERARDPLGDELASKSTPPIEDNLEDLWNRADKNSTDGNQFRTTRLSAIEPDPVSFSPSNSLQTQQYEFMQQDGLQLDGVNLLDLIEPGSGFGPPGRLDESVSMFNPALAIEPTSSLVGPGHLFTPTFRPASPASDDKPPELARRLPELFGSAGSAWRFKIPSGMFQDGDGDLRHLRSRLVPEQFVGSSESHEAQQGGAPQQLQWLRYDQATQTLYGFPTENDIGLNVFQLLVTDRMGSVSNATIRIAISPHQSSRAVTHLITIDGVEVANPSQMPTPELLSDFTKSVAQRVLADRTNRNMIIQSFKLSNATPTDDADLVSPNGQGANSTPKSILSVSWFNSSLPVHLCDPTGLEAILRALVDERQLASDWSLLNRAEQNVELRPSAALIRALEPNLRPSSVHVKLLGACDASRSKPASRISVTSRLGRLLWKLGQPIMYQIPAEMFEADGGQRSTRNLSLTLHTIDGKTLDQDQAFSFLEFDQATQTVFGLAFDVTKHVGQRELLLTARHPVTDERVRETFLIDIEAQDLTTINNRAFRISLYFMTPLSSFGPREQVQLSQQIVAALDTHQNPGRPGERRRDLNDAADFIVIAIQRFTTGSNIDNSATLSDPSNAWKFQDKIALVLDESPPAGPSWSEQTGGEQSTGANSLIYKLSWTNETIGHGGDCPVEVIKENILQALSEIDYNFDGGPEDATKNESARFYERLRNYFEPAIDLIHLRFEPTSACVDALELHDVGNSDIADIVDNAETHETEATETPLANILAKSLETSTPKAKPPAGSMSPINSDEYWAIVVLIILVVAIFFVVMMLIMGLHTYRINQEKRFELQMRLAQARQNSMYLSSLILSDQAQANDLLLQQQNYSNNQQPVGSNNKVAFINERIPRKPAILDQEKQLLASQAAYFKQPTSVQLMGDSVKTLPLNRNATFTMDSISSQAYPHLLTGVDQQQRRHVFVADQQRRSMTLNRRAAPNNERGLVGMPPRQASIASHLSHSQSIITVASMAPNQFAQQQPQIVYAPLPVPYEPIAEMPFDA